jgi:hypothetical protein
MRDMFDSIIANHIAQRDQRIAALEAQNAALLEFVNDVMTLDAPANYARAGLETLADKARALLAELEAKGEVE